MRWILISDGLIGDSGMDVFSRYNRKNIQDRQIDTLIGLSKGLTADGKVDQAEAEFLLSWLIQNSETDNPIMLNLLDKVTGFLEDGVLDKEESSELLGILRKLSGDPSEIGELAKSSSLPVCEPPPIIDYSDKTFLFTGTCAYGTRKECQVAISKLGGGNAKSVTKSLDYLILGTYVTDSWVHESFGRKIEKAVKYRDEGISLSIITEDYWLRESGLA